MAAMPENPYSVWNGATSKCLIATRLTPRHTCTTIVSWATPVAHHSARVRSCSR